MALSYQRTKSCKTCLLFVFAILALLLWRGDIQDQAVKLMAGECVCVCACVCMRACACVCVRADVIVAWNN